MRYALVMLMLVAVVPAAAQNVWSFEARSLAMGNVVVPVADDSASWLQNPAGLPWVQPCGVDCGDATSRVSATTDAGGRADTIGFNYSAHDGSRLSGWGAGYWELGKYDLGPMVSLSIERYGAGYGLRLSDELSVGVTAAEVDFDWTLPELMPLVSQESISAYQGRETIVDFGVMYRQVRNGEMVKAAAVARDLADNMAFTVDAGVAVAADGVLFGAEVRDVGGEVDTIFNVGAEWRPEGLPQLTILAGLADGDTTYGAGWDFDRWAVSISRQHLDWATETAVSLAGSF